MKAILRILTTFVISELSLKAVTNDVVIHIDSPSSPHIKGGDEANYMQSAVARGMPVQTAALRKFMGISYSAIWLDLDTTEDYSDVDTEKDDARIQQELGASHVSGNWNGDVSETKLTYSYAGADFVSEHSLTYRTGEMNGTSVYISAPAAPLNAEKIAASSNRKLTSVEYGYTWASSGLKDAGLSHYPRLSLRLFIQHDERKDRISGNPATITWTTRNLVSDLYGGLIGFGHAAEYRHRRLSGGVQGNLEIGLGGHKIKDSQAPSNNSTFEYFYRADASLFSALDLGDFRLHCAFGIFTHGMWGTLEEDASGTWAQLGAQYFW
jgi:hypothetical protein